jgi:DNA-binding LacI/PurR family transcriptional regulator
VAITLEDVARRAGVSVATASRALRGMSDVGDATRAKVSAAATELGFVGTTFTSRLASGRPATVGVVVPFIDRWFFAEVISAVESTIRTASLDLMLTLFNLRDTTGREIFFRDMPMRGRVDAMVVISLVMPESEVAALQALDVPIGVLGVKTPGAYSTRIDDYEGARKAVRHLISLGHERIAIIGDDPDGPMGFDPPGLRRRGYHTELDAAGLPIDPDLEIYGYFTTAGGAEAAGKLLSLPQRPTAIFCASDEMAWGALKVIRKAGLGIPEDVAVIGFDDHPAAELIDLSTIRQPVTGQAIDVTTRVLEALDFGIAHPEDGDVVLPTELIVRGSTDPAHSTL